MHTPDFFRSRIDIMINPNDPLAVLVGLVNPYGIKRCYIWQPNSMQGCQGCLGRLVQHLQQGFGSSRRAALALLPVANGVE